MYAPPWRIWLTGLLSLGWLALALRFLTVKNEPVLAGLAFIMGLLNIYFTWQLLTSTRRTVAPEPPLERGTQPPEH